VAVSSKQMRKLTGPENNTVRAGQLKRRNQRRKHLPILTPHGLRFYAVGGVSRRHDIFFDALLCAIVRVCETHRVSPDPASRLTAFCFCARANRQFELVLRPPGFQHDPQSQVPGLECTLEEQRVIGKDARGDAHALRGG